MTEQRELPPGYRIEPLRWSEQREATRLLVRAFRDDPLVNAICGPPNRDGLRRMYWSFLLSVRGHSLSSQPAWVVRHPRGVCAGLVLVSRAGMALQSPGDTWFSLRALFRIGWNAARRGAEAAEAIVRHAPPFPFTYVRTLAVDPGEQNQGLGSALLCRVFAHSPATWPVYLETARERNVLFYGQHGFHCIGMFRCLDVPIWRMLRPAAPGSHGNQTIRTAASAL